MDNNKIGKFIASLRAEKGLTQKELADKLYLTDKAVSKWERGLSLPDITLLEKLADVLDTDIYSILQIDKKKDIDVKQILEDEGKKIKRQINKKTRLFMFPFIILTIFLLFKLLPFGYKIDHPRFTHNVDKIINLGIPKFSFYMNNKQSNYSYKNFRGKYILKSEIKNYVDTLEHISCNNTIYYYDVESNFTIVEYNVKSSLFYNTLSYDIRNGNYCRDVEIKEYKKKIGNLDVLRVLYTENSNLYIYFLPSLKNEDDKNVWTATMSIFYQGSKEVKTVEKSSGTFKIDGDELSYYRNEISTKADDLVIPSISTFVIKDQKLILKENYLKDYKPSVILKEVDKDDQKNVKK